MAPSLRRESQLLSQKLAAVPFLISALLAILS